MDFNLDNSIWVRFCSVHRSTEVYPIASRTRCTSRSLLYERSFGPRKLSISIRRFVHSFLAFQTVVWHSKSMFLLASEDRQAINLQVLRSEEHTSELQSLMRISYAV